MQELDSQVVILIVRPSNCCNFLLLDSYSLHILNKSLECPCNPIKYCASLYTLNNHLCQHMNFSNSHGFLGFVQSKATMLQIHVNSQENFFLHEKIISTYSGRLKKLIKHEKRTQIKSSGVHIHEFPGGPNGFELASRFCYNNGNIDITISNVCLLHCSAVFLDMTEKVSACNLLQQTERFLEGIFYWSWNEIIECLKSCESFFACADSAGLVERLINVLLAKFAHNLDANLIASYYSSSSSPETGIGFRLSSSFKTTPESIKSCSSTSRRPSWFDDMTILPPTVIEKFVKILGVYGTENNSLVLTRFLLHYLKTHFQQRVKSTSSCSDGYSCLADTAVYGVILSGKNSFSCRGLFSVLRLLSGFGLSKVCRVGLERVIGEMLDLATLDDLLVSGHEKSVYDVNLVVRLTSLFVNSDQINVHKLKKVGRLIDKYLCEIAPDHSLKISKFLKVAESLPDSCRDCFDDVYKALDIYLESHSSLSFEKRARLCRCINYNKLTLEACKDMGKNPRIPPRVAMQALLSKSNSSGRMRDVKSEEMVLYKGVDGDSFSKENEDMRMNLQRMQWRVVELEKVCRDMKGQMSNRVIASNF